MSTVAPISPAEEHKAQLENELKRTDPVSTQPQAEVQPPAHVEDNQRKQAENLTLYGFQYTGMGSFIDKVF